MMGLAANGVAEKSMTLGDLVLVNAYLIQLFIPLNFLGTIYREIRNALTSELLTDFGGVATFYSCLVQVERCGD